jgi:hypothetical protein
MRRTAVSLLVMIALVGSVAGCCVCDCLRSCRRPHADPARAGNTDEVSCCAQPSDTGSYVGYQVGGGAPCKGDGPYYDDGTWGWDYEGCLIPSNVILGWWHGRKCQGGAGAYRADGPRVIETIERRHEE